MDALNTPLLLETALLMLAAFLVGAVLGTAARWLFARPKPVVTPVAVTEVAAAPAGPPLVVAPEIVAVAARPTVAERVAAAAEGRSAATPTVGMSATVAMPRSSLPDTLALRPMAPAHAPGETVDGRHIDNPEKRDGPVEAAETSLVATPADLAGTQAEAPAAAAAPVVELLAEPARLDPVDRIEPSLEAIPLDLLDAPEDVARDLQEVHAIPADAAATAVQAEPPLVEPQVERDAAEADETLLDRVPPESAALDEHEAERAAMRAIESGWTPRPSATPRPAAELPEPALIPANDADAAVAGAGAAVAQALARANAVLAEIAPAAETAAPPAEPEPVEVTPVRPAQRGGFGRPAALEAPRDGAPDDLTAIRGVTPTIAAALNGLGIFHFDQLADWDQKAVVWVENHFGFKGRVAREKWLDQARDLVRGRPSSPRRVRR